MTDHSDPLTFPDLHEIAVRRRGDPDVKALLLEIKRLHGTLVQAHKATAALPRYDDNLNAAAGVLRLLDLFEDEPAIGGEQPDRYGKPRRGPPAENEGERAAKRTAREKRG